MPRVGAGWKGFATAIHRRPTTPHIMLRAALARRMKLVPSRALCTATDRVSSWLANFQDRLAAGRAEECFAQERAFWRDMVAFTWTLKTFEGSSEIGAALATTAATAQPQNWSVDGVPTTGLNGETECFLRFTTTAGSAVGHVRLDGHGKAVTLATSLRDLSARPFATGRRRALGHPVTHVRQIATPRRGRRYWHERRAASLPAALGGEADNEPYVLIIGGGQAGLSLGARLHLLGIRYIIVEAHPRVGDSWRSRYPGLLLHDPVWCVARPLSPLAFIPLPHPFR